MPTIASVPSTFTVVWAPGAGQVVTFAIPPGLWVSGTWTVNGTWTVTGGLISGLVTLGAHPAPLAGHTVNGTYTDTAALTADQIADVNTAASGTGVLTGRLDVVGAAGFGHVDVSSFTLTLTGCAYALDPTSAAYTAAGGSGSFSLTTTSTCPWTAASNNSWLHVTAGAAGTGSGTVSYSVDAQAVGSDARTGTITAGGQTFTVTQVGIPMASLSGEIRPHPHTHAVSQFITVTFEGGYMAGVDVDAACGALSRVLFAGVKPRAWYNARLVGSVLVVYDATGTEIADATPITAVDIWRFGY